MATIVNGVYTATSPSQIQTFKSCKRKWAFDKFWGVKRPDTEATIRGKNIHKALELYSLNRSYDSTMEPYVMAVKNYLTRPHIGVEANIELPTFPGGPKMVGVIDRLEQNALVDYKTLSDMKYAATPEELMESTQMNSYGYWWYQHHDTKEWLEYIHLNILVKKGTTPKVKKVNTTVNYDQVKMVWDRDMRTVHEMNTLVQSCYKPARDDDHIDQLATTIEPTTSSCDAYGGCFYRNRCGLGKDSPLTLKWLKPKVSENLLDKNVQADVHKGNNMSLKDKLLAKKAAQPQTPAPGNGATHTPAVGKSLEEKLATTSTVTSEEISVLDEKLAVLQEQVEALPDTTANVSIVPPDAPKDVIDVVAADAPVQTTTTVDPQPARRGPGRPKKATTEPQGVPIQNTPMTSGMHLYIDCFPVKGPHKNYILAEDWIKPIAEKVAFDAGQADYRLIQYTAKAQLAIAVRAALTELPEAMVIMSFAGGSDVLMECLIPYAVSVIRGK